MNLKALPTVLKSGRKTGCEMGMYIIISYTSADAMLVFIRSVSSSI